MSEFDRNLLIGDAGAALHTLRGDAAEALEIVEFKQNTVVCLIWQRAAALNLERERDLHTLRNLQTIDASRMAHRDTQVIIRQHCQLLGWDPSGCCW
jgi:hypothetical protein